MLFISDLVSERREVKLNLLVDEEGRYLDLEISSS